MKSSTISGSRLLLCNLSGLTGQLRYFFTAKPSTDFRGAGGEGGGELGIGGGGRLVFTYCTGRPVSCLLRLIILSAAIQ